MTAVGDGDASEVFARRAELVQVALPEHRNPLRRCEQAVRRVPGEVRVVGRRHRRPVLHTCTEAMTGALVERAVAHDVVGDTGVDGEHRLLDRAARRATAVVDTGEEAELADPQVLRDLDLGVRVGGERDHAVDLRRLDAGIDDRRLTRLDGKPKVGAPGVLRELGCTDADDRGGVEETVAVAHCVPPDPCGSTRVTVPTR